MPAVTVTAPGTSRRAPAAAGGVRGSSTAAPRKTPMPMGMFTRKTQCQLSESVRMPPSRTPMAPPPAATKPKKPMARAAPSGSRHRGPGSERQADGGDDGGADALHGAGGDEHALRRGEAARQRGQGEQRDAGEEHAARAVQVAEAAAQQEAAAEGQHVGVDHPRQVGGGEVQVGLHGRQGDVDDGGVEDLHERAEAQDGEGEPEAAAGQAVAVGGARGRRGRSRVGVHGGVSEGQLGSLKAAARAEASAAGLTAWVCLGSTTWRAAGVAGGARGGPSWRVRGDLLPFISTVGARTFFRRAAGRLKSPMTAPSYGRVCATALASFQNGMRRMTNSMGPGTPTVRMK